MKIKIRSFQTLLIFSAILILTFQTFFFTSCSNFFGENNSLPENSGASTESHLVTITGKVLLEGAIPSKLFHNSEGMDRTAFPQLPSLTSLSFNIKATNKNDETDCYESSNVDTVSNTYILTIPAPTQAEVVKTYNITITARNGTTDVLTGTSEDIDLSLENTVFTEDITLHAISTSGSGSINLSIIVDKEAGNPIANEAHLVIGSNDYVASYIDDGFQFNLPNETYPDAVFNAGVYPARFSFKKGTEEVYSFTQYVNIFSGLDTNTWVKNGNEPYFEESGSSTIVHITRSLLNSYILTDFYVDKSRQKDNPDEPGYTTASGTFLNPLTTFKAAVDKIQNSTRDYTIHVKGEFQGCFELPAGLDSKMNSLTIVGESPLVNGEPQDRLYGCGAVFGNETNFHNIETSDKYTTLSSTEGNIGSVLKIETSKPVTLKNLEISDGIAMQGAGLYLNGANVTINNLLVKNNKAKSAGGGILAENSSVTMNDGKITGNSAKTSEASNVPGGGIVIKGTSTFIMNNGEISHNDSDMGGGINLLAGDGRFTMNGGTITENHSTFAGGGIYNAGVTTINRGTISQNSSDYGGGINNDGTLTITGGEISGNTAEEKGGAIYVSAGSTEYPLKLGQNAYIPAGPNNTNDILLFKNDYYNINAKITLIGPLTRHSATSPINLTFESYEIGLTAVIADGTNITELTDYKDCFATTNSDANLRFPIDDYTKLLLDMPIFVKQGGTSAEQGSADGTRAKPFASIAEACAAMDSSDRDYTILVDGADNPLQGPQKIPEGVAAKSITIMGANGLYPAGHEKAGEPKDALNGKKVANGKPVLEALCACPVVLGNIKITGANNENSGGGVSRKKGDLYIHDGTLITGNKAYKGFGVYLYAESETINLYMSGGKITSNEEYNSTATSYGGGIYATKAISADSTVKCNVFIYGSAVIGGPYSSLLDTKDKALKNGGNAGTKLCGSGVYCWGNLYLGYKSANSDGSPSEEAEWTGAIRGNYTSEGTEGGVSIHGNLYMHSGEISYNYKEKNTNSGGGGIGVASDSYIELSGGKIHHNYSWESGGGVYVNHATFKMTGGEIYANKAQSGGGVCVATGYTFIMSGGSVYGNEATEGGGIYTRGQVFICGDATIGQKGEAVTSASSESVSNKANYGGGICGYDEGRIYLGYKSANDDENKTPNEAEEWTGGIYCNSAICGGGIGAYQESNWFIKSVYMNGGTIMGNYASKNGGGINNTSKLYMTGGLITKNHCGSEGKGSGIHFALSTSVFQMSGPACVLPESDGSNDVYFKNTEIKITVAGHLAPTVTGKAGDTAADYAACIVPKDNTQVLLTAPEGINLSDYAPLFKIKPQNGDSTLVKDGLNGLEYGIGADGKYGSMIYVTESSDGVCDAIMELVSESSQANPVNICFTTDFAPTRNVTHGADASYNQGTEAILRVPEGKYLNITASKPISIKKTYSGAGNIIYCEKGNLSVGPNITLDGNDITSNVVRVNGGEATFTGCEIKGATSDGIATLSGRWQSRYNIQISSTKVNINSGTKIHDCGESGIVSNCDGTIVTLNGGEIYNCNYAGIFLSQGGTVICPNNSAVSIRNNKKSNSSCQVYFNSGTANKWGTSSEDLQEYSNTTWSTFPQ